MRKKEIVVNVLWKFLERAGAQGVSLIVSIILARLLEPSIYGQIALVTVWITILNVFVDSGLGQALIQKKDVDDLDFSSVFYFNIILGIALYTILFFVAPLVAHFYQDEELIPVIRVLGVVLIIYGLKNTQQAYISKNMQFRKFFFSTLGGTIVAAVVGIILANNGAGIWALVIQYVANGTIDTIILWFTTGWKPKKQFCIERLNTLLKFGWKLLVSGIINTLYNNISQLIIGKIYSKNELAYYNQGDKYPSVIVANVDAAISSVLLPAMSKVQDDKVMVKSILRRSIQLNMIIICPLMVGFIAVSEPLIRLLLTDKWLPCVFFLRIFCISYMFWPIHTSNLCAITALGRSDLFLKLEIWKKAVGIVLIIISANISVEAMAYSVLISNFACQIINSWPNKYLIGYSYQQQLKDIVPILGISVIMGVCVYFVGLCKLQPILLLCIQVLVGIVVYVILAKCMNIEIYIYSKSVITDLFKNN